MNEENNDKQDSIEVSKSTKGVYSWKLKLYYDQKERHSSDIITKLKLMDDAMIDKFPNEEN